MTNLKINHNLPPPKQTPYKLEGLVPIIYPQDVANWVVHVEKPTTHSVKNPNYNYDTFQGDYATPEQYKKLQEYWKTKWPEVKRAEIERMKRDSTFTLNAATKGYTNNNAALSISKWGE